MKENKFHNYIFITDKLQIVRVQVIPEGNGFPIKSGISSGIHVKPLSDDVLSI